MKAIYIPVVILAVLLHTVYSFSQFGRSCDDIGCSYNEECVMASKPCSYFDRKNECGDYPTCKKISNGPRTCDTYVCPPSKVCKMDGGQPKCFDDASKVGKVPVYDTGNLNNRYDGNSGQNDNRPATSGGYKPSAPNAPSAPRYDGGSLYPTLGDTGSNYGQGGYRPQGGYPNTGYQQPGGNYGGYQQPAGNQGYNSNQRPSGYGQQNVGYGTGYNQGTYRPQAGGNTNGYQQPGHYNPNNYNSRNNQGNQQYPTQGYNNGYQQPGQYNPYNYNNRNSQGNQQYTTKVPEGYYVAGAGYQQPSKGGYGSSNNRYQSSGYGYSQGNQGYGGYGNNDYNNNNRYGQNSRYGYRGDAGSSVSDTIKEALKKIGLLILVVHYFSQSYGR